MDAVDGIILLDKPRGLSSNSALQRVRRLLHARKAGHVGSLDPLATGMLPICLGEATKIAGDILAGRKCYRFGVRLGERTATGDSEGPVVETAAVPDFAPAQLATTLGNFLGEQQQIPPMYSALKRDGQPLYKLARAGIEVERAPRRVQIDSLTLTDPAEAVQAPGGRLLWLQVVCSKGTYVRTLAEDIARALGTCGHVIELRRLYVEPFSSAAMQTLDALEHQAALGDKPALLAADIALQHLPAVMLDSVQAGQVRHGQSVAARAPAPLGRVRLYDAEQLFLGMGEADAGHRIHPRRLFAAGVAALSGR
jgi:tRNA pseudouridine55 synthase